MARAEQAPEELSDLSLEELTTLQFSSAARRVQKASDVPAAAFVITQDDIRRAGAQSIPDALRLAPGLHVAQLDASRWAISARGFNGRFANKLLVLMDGRTVYTPTFSGTYWETQDTRIEDVERIEVIRGPAGTIWGANAVNGIINIITKRAAQTDGFAATSTSGTDGRRIVDARHGSADQQNRMWRAYAKHVSVEENELANGAPSYDDAQQWRAGMRADLLPRAEDVITISAEAHRGRAGQTLSGVVMTPLQFDASTSGIADREAVEGYWSNAHWAHRTVAGSNIELQSYFEHYDRNSQVYSERRDTFDLHLQHSLPILRGHTLTWGAGGRWSGDRFTGGQGMVIVPIESRFWLLSAYAQDEIKLAEPLRITLGARGEDADYGGAAVLPNLRVVWTPTERSALWAAVAQGERRPGRAESDVRLLDHVQAPLTAANSLPLPIVTDFVGGRQFASERLTAHEAGWRWNSNTWSLDVAAFYNQYRDLRGSAGMQVTCQPTNVSVSADPSCLMQASWLEAYTELSNPDHAKLYGGEVIARWAPSRHWRLTASHALLRKQLHTTFTHPSVTLFIVGQDPEHQTQVRSSLSLGAAWDWDMTWRSLSGVHPAQIPGYDEINTRLAWRPLPEWEVALVGQNLLHRAHREAVSEYSDLLPTSIQRSYSLQVRWSVQ